MSAWLTSFHEHEALRWLVGVFSFTLQFRPRLPLRVVYRWPKSATGGGFMWTRVGRVRHDMRFSKNESNALIASVMCAPVVGRRPVR